MLTSKKTDLELRLDALYHECDAETGDELRETINHAASIGAEERQKELVRYLRSEAENVRADVAVILNQYANAIESGPEI